jgi:hypothetical protein
MSSKVNSLQRQSGQPVKPASSQPHELLPLVFAGMFGGFLGLALLKFGNPPIMEKWVSYPSGFFEFLVGTPWPTSWAYWLLGLTTLVGLPVLRSKPQPPFWLLVLPLVWFAWQLVASAFSVDFELSRPALKHFAACITCFYLGLFALSRVDRLWPFFVGLFCGFTLVIAIGLDQHFGGLEESRRYFYRQLYLYPQAKDVPPEFLKKIASNRIYSTLFYPNTLAGALLLFLPAMLVAGPSLRDRLQSVSSSRIPALAAIIGITLADLYLYLLGSKFGWVLVVVLGLIALFPMPRWALPSLLTAGTLACLYWSGSKGGWLLMLLLGLIALLRVPFAKQLKIVLLTVILVGGLAGFFWKYSGFFRKGATSVVARFDYWRAAVQTAKAHPILGTGPGTFSIPYEQLKRPESEMARLVHNDFLEQASDSGIVGLAAYTVFLAAALIWTFRRTVCPAAGYTTTDPLDTRLRFAVWLGVLGWSLQGLVEFPVYIPALAWPAFTFLGVLLGKTPASEGPVFRPAILR